MKRSACSPLIAAQDLAHGTLQVVVAQAAKDTPEIAKPEFVRFQESLLRGVIVGPMKRSPAGHRAHGELPDLAALAADLGDRFVPIDLSFLAPGINLRHERLAHDETHLPLAMTHIPAHARLRHSRFGPLLANPLEDAMRGVPLLARSLLV